MVRQPRWLGPTVGTILLVMIMVMGKEMLIDDLAQFTPSFCSGPVSPEGLSGNQPSQEP